MKTWLRKLRGILGIGVIWGVAGSALGVTGWAIASIFGINPPRSEVIVSLLNGVPFFAVGSGFAVVLTMMDGRRTFDELSPKRAALWGALAGATVFPIVACLIVLGLGLGNEIPLAVLIAHGLIFGGAVTAGLAAGTVSLARRAPGALGAGTVPHESKLLGDPDENIPHQFGPIWRKEQ